MLKRIPFYSAFGISSVVDDARVSASSKWYVSEIEVV